MIKIEIPDFEYSGFYYPEILQDLIQYCRTNVPEITDESPEEPFIQLLRAFALGAHVNNVLLDLVAKERFLPTASLRSSVRAHLALIDVQLEQASPAVADLLLELSQVFTSTQLIVPEFSKFATPETPNDSAIDFEALDELQTLRTDQLTKCYAYDASADAWTDHTAEAISPSGNFTPGWTGGPAVGDALYIGHQDILWDELNVVIAVAATGISAGVWEFWDGEFDYTVPDLVTNGGTTLTFDLNGFLGTDNRTGTLVRVKSNITGAYEDLVSVYASGQNRVTTTGFLGQGSPSTSVQDYIVGSEWKPLKDVSDASTRLTTVGSHDITYELPQTLLEKWAKVTVGSTILEANGYWLRFRVTAVSGATNPSITQIRLDTGKQYALATVTQGSSQADDPLGSSTGLASQQFQLARFPVLDDSTLSVHVTESIEEEWSRVDNFLNSTSVDKHYRVEFDDDGRAVVIFGDGLNGKIPAAGTNNVRAEYRTMEEQDGNVGQNTITVNKAGVAFVNKLYNPRAASGYRIREGATPEDIARLKVAGPASLRTKDRAVTLDDVETLAAAFTNAAGSRPIGRALAIEEAFGPKTIEVVVVGTGGSAVALSDREELADYFNGNVEEKIKGKLLLNHEATITNFTPKTVNVTATVYGGNLTAVKTALTALLNPVALEEDGVSFVWDFATEVPISKITAAIMDTEPKPRKTTIATPAGDTPLGQKELPVAGTLNITILP